MGRYPRRNLIGKAAIQEKSTELEIPMERLLAGYVVEQLAVKLSESERGKRLLLKNTDIFGLSGYERGGSRRLYYAYVKQPGEVFGKADFAAFLKNTIKWETQTNIQWSWRSHMEGSRLIVELMAVLEDMRMPIELLIDPLDEGSPEFSAGEYPLRLLMETNKTCEIAVYPVQELLFDDLYEVLTKLELIGDMAVYERIYETLGMLNFEGRPLQKELERFFEEHGIDMDERRFAQMERYLTYPYMIKKWRSYLKKCGKTHPEWEDVYGRFWRFLMPVWSAGLEGMIYLGSWIGDLGRYLD